MVSPILELTNINKSFGHVHANKNINLTINKGTIHGIIGENGAGKSTLMSIVFGLYQANSGTIKVNGKEINLRSPKDSIINGIGMVHQHFMLVENFTVLENIILGFEGELVFGKNLEKAKKDLKDLCDTYKLNIDLNSTISDLSVGFRQRVEILKSLYRGAEILILDEPTGVLTPQEVDELFKILRSLNEEGKTIVRFDTQGKVMPSKSGSKMDLGRKELGKFPKAQENNLGDIVAAKPRVAMMETK